MKIRMLGLALAAIFLLGPARPASADHWWHWWGPSVQVFVPAGAVWAGPDYGYTLRVHKVRVHKSVVVGFSSPYPGYFYPGPVTYYAPPAYTYYAPPAYSYVTSPWYAGYGYPYPVVTRHRIVMYRYAPANGRVVRGHVVSHHVAWVH